MDDNPFSSILKGFQKPNLSTYQVKPEEIKGPALVYTAWAGKGCGTIHNLPAIAKASAELAIPVYVINSDTKTLEDDKPGIRVVTAHFNASVKALGDYGLVLQDKRVRLVGPDGKMVPTKDISSNDDIVGTFKPIVEKLRPAPTKSERTR